MAVPPELMLISGSDLLAHDEHVGAPQVLVGRLAVERALQKRRHSRRHGVSIEVARFRLLAGTGRTQMAPATKKMKAFARRLRGGVDT